MGRPSDGVVLAVKDGTALIEGVKSVLRDSVSELEVVGPGRRRPKGAWSSPPFINRPSLPRRLALMPSKCVRKSLFSIAEATMMGRGFRIEGGGYP